MKRFNARRRRTPLLGLALGLLTLLCAPARAGTIFVLTDPRRALFFNNEDWSNPASRLWFVPAGKGHRGCAYVGFDNGWAQGGVNTEGLAFDWVAGFGEKWQPAPALRSVRGNPSQRMLETCATVDAAIAFYRGHWEPDFARAKIMVADRTGASAIIGAKDGQLQVERANQCRGFGYGREILDRRLAKPPEPTVANGVAILRACLQTGEFATKYSSVYDLKHGDLFLFPVPTQADEVKLNLAAELKLGAHYYELPLLREQLGRPSLPLPPNRRRFYLDELKPLVNQEPAVTRRLRAVVKDVIGGTMRADDYTVELWQTLAPAQKDIQAETKGLGELTAMTLVDRTIEGPRRSFRYLMDFQNARVLQRYVLDDGNKVALIRSEIFELKPKSDDRAD